MSWTLGSVLLGAALLPAGGVTAAESTHPPKPAQALEARVLGEPPVPQERALPLGSFMSAGPRWIGPPITLILDDADLRDVIETLSRLMARNVVIDGGVRGTVTASLRDVPADQALDLFLVMNGLGRIQEHDVMVVAPIRRLMSW